MVRLLGALLLTVAAPTALAMSARAEPIEIATTRVYLDMDQPSQPGAERFGFVGGLEISSSDPRFGGLSGLTLAPGGDRLIAVSDRGYWFTARLEESDKGRPTGLADAQYAPILDTKGRPVRRSWSDAEAVEAAADGALLVSFEGRHRIWRYPNTGDLFQARAKPVGTPKKLRKAPSNSGVEAFQPLPDGALLVLTENYRDDQGDRRGWLVRGRDAAPLTLRRTGEFKPTDLALLPDGDLLLLERRFSLLGGLGIRVSRIRAADIKPGARLVPKEIARLAPPQTIDNFEAMAVRPGPDGTVAVYLLSDDNFNALQRTLLMKFLLVD